MYKKTAAEQYALSCGGFVSRERTLSVAIFEKTIYNIFRRKESCLPSARPDRRREVIMMPEDTRSILLKFSQQVKKILGAKLIKIILYGSYARGDFSENSDVDVMILTTLTDDEIEKQENQIFDLAFQFLMEYGIDISVIIKNDEHFYHWLGALPFYDNVNQEGVVLNG